MNRRIWLSVLAVAAVLVAAFLLRQVMARLELSQAQEAAKEDRYAPMVAQDNELLLYFKDTYVQYQVILACQEDITNDGLADLVVIYHDPAQQGVNFMRGVLVTPDSGRTVTDASRAPIENQQIRFFNMDKEAELEFVVTGEKDGEVGYAIYRVIGGVLTDLFGEGMEACC